MRINQKRYRGFIEVIIELKNCLIFVKITRKEKLIKIFLSETTPLKLKGFYLEIKKP